jgi:hypothetical protein
MPRKKYLPPPSPEEEVAELKGLMDEQEGMAEESARRDPRKLSAVWIAKGDHLVLLVTKAVGLKAKKTRYTCRILTVDSDL